MVNTCLAEAAWLATRFADDFWNNPESIGVDYKVVRRVYGVEIIDAKTGEVIRYADYDHLRFLFY